MKIIATNLGKRKEVVWKGTTISTGIFKFPVEHPIFLDRENVEGDEICDSRYHGGQEQAVYGYSWSHYSYWRKNFPDLDWQYGMFGENLTVDFLDETALHKGDIFRVGKCIIEVTKQRNPCVKLGIRFEDQSIVKKFWNTTMCGVYFKIIQSGTVKVGDELKCLKKCPENPTIAELYMAKRKSKDI